MSKDADFCKRLRLIRTARGLTQSDLEVKSGLPAMVLSHYENGTRAPGLANIKALCKGLGCTATDLLGI